MKAPLRYIYLFNLVLASSVAAETYAVPELPMETFLPLPAPIAPAGGLQEDVVSKRLFGIIPNHRADQLQSDYKPLSVAEKFKIARSDSFDWPNYFLLVGYAMQSQMAEGGFRKSGGLDTFAKFYSRSVGDQIIGSYVTEAILPALFREDPRFFRLGKGSAQSRAFYAITRVLVTRTDQGRNTVNLSELAGNMGVTAIATIYYPDGRSAPEALERYGMTLGNDVVSNLLTEFWPDIKRRFTSRHHE